MKSHEMLGAAEQRNKTRCAYREATKNKSEIVLYTSSRVDCRCVVGWGEMWGARVRERPGLAASM